MKQKYLLFGLLGLMLGFVVALSMFSVSTSLSTNFGDGIQYRSQVCIYENRWNPELQQYGGQQLIECDHNNITNNGRDAIELMLGAINPSATPGNFTFIGLGNSSKVWTVSDANATLDNLYNITSGVGLNITNGVYVSHATPGNWSIYKTFTATTTDVKTNVTILTNGTGDGILNYTMFAWKTFSDVTLQTNDQLTINWTIWVS